MQAGSQLYTDSAGSYRALKGYVHEFVNHTQKEYARGDMHENRAECLFSLLKPSLRVFRDVSKCTLPGDIGFVQFLRNFRQHKAFEQAELILQAALDPAIASRARSQKPRWHVCCAWRVAMPSGSTISTSMVCALSTNR